MPAPRCDRQSKPKVRQASCLPHWLEDCFALCPANRLSSKGIRCRQKDEFRCACPRLSSPWIAMRSKMKLLLPGVDSRVRCPKTKRAAPCERGLMRCLRVANARFAGPAEPGPELLLHMAAEIPTSSPNSGHKANTKICGIKGLGGW